MYQYIISIGIDDSGSKGRAELVDVTEGFFGGEGGEGL